MTDILQTVYVRSDRPVERVVVEILGHVDAAVRRQGVRYFVCGALARDLILLHVYDQKPGRATRDVDLGVCVGSWSEFEALKIEVMRCGFFVQNPTVAHLLYYKAAGVPNEVPIDLIPFGGVQDLAPTAGDMDVEMSVAGFSEAAASCILVRINEGLAVPVASLPALAILKLFAWLDRHGKTEQDAADFLLLARYYYLSGNFDRLYEAESELLRATDYDPELAGAMLLGKDAARLCEPDTAARLLGLLSDDRLRKLLIDQILRTALQIDDDRTVARVERYVECFRVAFTKAARELNDNAET